MDPVTSAQAPDPRPAPAPSAATAGFWAAAAQGELAIQRCDECLRFAHPPHTECPTCGGKNLAFTPVSGRGTIETFSIVHRSFAPGFRSGTPYVIAWVALEEQPSLRIFSNVIGIDPSDVRIGMPVAVTFTDLVGFGMIPEFRRADVTSPTI